jgi:hypothetical protein
MIGIYLVNAYKTRLSKNKRKNSLIKQTNVLIEVYPNNIWVFYTKKRITIRLIRYPDTSKTYNYTSDKVSEHVQDVSLYV